MQTNDLDSLKTAINKAKDVFVLISQHPNPDTVAASLVLYLVLSEAGKTVHIACPSPMRVEFSRLVGVDKVTTEIGNQNLVISFDYVKDSIEKVSYNVKEDKFNLIVQPKKGFNPLDPKQVQYSYSGATSDITFIVGAMSLENLGALYQDNKSLFTESHTISINKLNTTPFAETSVADPNSSSLSEIVYNLLSNFGFPIKDDIATNLLTGIDYATNRFASPNIPYTAFQAAANLLQNGAQRLPGKPQEIKPEKPVSKTPPPPLPLVADQEPPHPATQAPATPVMQPMTPSVSEQIPPDADRTQETVAEKTASPSKTPPPEWLEPKIYRGSTKV